MQEALRLRNQSQIMRLEITAPEKMRSFLKKKLEVGENEICEIQSWMDLKTISQISAQPIFSELKRPAWIPTSVPDFETADDLWSLLKKKDVLVHHPYESFETVNRFLREAADDPDVLMIKQTLYRAGHDSSVISSLERATEKGKQVTVLVELKARFDEEKNIEWARRLELRGANILYGVAGFKTHVKACLVVRREPEGIVRYVHLSTGNYNEKTAQIYSDIGLFTSNEEIANDVSALFNVITGFSQPLGFSKIEMAPYGLKRSLRRLILRESMHSNKSQPGLILAKMNSLVDPDIIEALYHASKAGVVIKLNVRGICCLKPGVKGLSENIEVMSIIDTFLEHSRIFYFSNAGNEEIYLSSADWMPRNLERRIEIMFPIENPKLKKDLTELLKLYFKDNVKSWRLLASGEYEKIASDSEKKFRVQELLCARAQEREENFKKAAPQELKPQRPK
jgi:polyphosphate kinase